MTISSTTRVAGPFTGNGTASAFPFAFKVFAAADLAVYRTAIATGVVTTLTLTTDYTVTLTDTGGTVTLTGGNLATGQQLLIVSAVPQTQSVDLTNQGGFYPEVINDALDRATVQVQQVQVQANRSIRFPPTETGISAELPKASDRANQYLAFGADGSVDIGGAVPDQRYYGAKTSDPATRNDGTARVAGDLYFNSVANTMKVFNGSAWDTVTTTPVDGDKGDITLSGGASTYTIDNDVVTFAKMANIATDRLVGRDTASTGDPEALTVGGGIEFTGSGGIQTSAFTGDVTKSAGGTALTIANGAVTSAKLDTNIDIAGTLTMTAGDIIVANTKGIDFSATANGVGTPTTEKLTDYEEGTWVPVYQAATGTFTTLTMDVVSAQYTKIGKMVTVSAHIRTDNVSLGTASGNIYVGGLPYPIDTATHGGGVVIGASNWSTDHPCSLWADTASASRMVLLYRNTAGNSATSAIQHTDLTTGATADRNVLIFTATYWTA